MYKSLTHKLVPLRLCSGIAGFACLQRRETSLDVLPVIHTYLSIYYNRLLLNDKRKSYNFVLANEFSFQKTKRERIENWAEFCTQGQIHDFMKGEIRRQGHGVLQQEMLKIWL